MNNTKVLLSIRNLKKYFPLKKKSIFSREQLYVRANENISLDIHEGETIGVVGESGCGKSTLGRVLLQLYSQTAGTTMYYGRSLDEIAPKYVRETLKNANKYIEKYKAEEAQSIELDKQLEAQGDNASYGFHIKVNLAHDKAEKTLSDVSKILGGFMALSKNEVTGAANLLLHQHNLNTKLVKLNEHIKNMEMNLDVLESRKKADEETAENSMIVSLKKRKNDANANRKALKDQIAEIDGKIEAEVKKHTGEAEFDKYQALKDDGIDLSRLTYNEIRPLRRDIQIIFQDPYSSLDPRMTVGQIIGEGLVTHKIYKKGSEKMKEHIKKTMKDCGLQSYMVQRYPHQFSGGQRQRICIARALAISPKFVVCDEAVSALDVSIQSQIINLLHDLKERDGLTYMFISHDLSVVKYISDRIAVMYLGDLVELATSDEMFKDPRHPYTVALLSSIPTTDLDNKKERILLEGNIPSPINPPTGCKFRTRCFMATEKCSRIPPQLTEVTPGHYVACHYPQCKLKPDGNYTDEVYKAVKVEKKDKA